MNLNFYHTTYTKIYLKWTINLNIKAKTIKILRENICKFGIGKHFLYRTQKE